MEKTLQELAEYVGGAVIGNPSILIRGVMGIDEAQEGHITFVSNDKYIKKSAKLMLLRLSFRPN